VKRHACTYCKTPLSWWATITLGWMCKDCSYRTTHGGSPLKPPPAGAGPLDWAKTPALGWRMEHTKFEDVAKQVGAHYYGSDGTIHGTTQLDVETDAAGTVVAVWFRCRMLPFQQIWVGEERAGNMRAAPISDRLAGFVLRDGD
jgi:hypothetical protein